jgi:hypothetical protein
MERREATEQSRTDRHELQVWEFDVVHHVFVEKKHHRVLLLLLVVVDYTQANKKARKKERKGVGHVWIPCLCLQCTE